MKRTILNNKFDLGKAAAKQGASLIKQAISKNGKANVIIATGASQFEMLKALVQEDIDWSVVTCFHLDEYIDLPETHPASFRKYLKERFANIVKPFTFHYVNGENNVKNECLRLHNLIIQHPIDVAFVGIGENAHLAFNDPPADFDIKDSYLEVVLDLDCRIQQLGEGWFKSLEEVPTKAISMSINRIIQSQHIICSVPDKRKRIAVDKVINGQVTPKVPASILQKHKSTYLFLDKESSSLLNQ